MTSNARFLTDKAALITGATSGIGTACAREMVALGARLLLTGRSEERGAEVVSDICSGGGEAHFIAGDVRDAEFCRRLVDEAVSRLGRIDILVNNAGIAHSASTLETTDAQWHDILATNLTAVFLLSRAALHAMRNRGSGAIVNVASDWGLVAGSGAVAYCASKGGVVNLTRAMALDHAGDGIRVNVVCPGDTDTPMMLRDFQERGLSVEEGTNESAAGIPMGRMATPEEVAHAICFLASDAASYITGAALPIDGGHTAG